MDEDSRKRVAAIYEHFRAECPPFAFEGAWRFVTPDADTVGCIAEAARVQESLAAKFSADDLQEAKVLVPGSDGGPSLNTCLTAAGPLLLLRDSSGQALDIVSSAGCVSGRSPFWQVRRDARFASMLAPRPFGKAPEFKFRTF
jgi:hypothetical protein